MKETLLKLYNYQILSRKEAENLVLEMTKKPEEEALIASILSTFNMRKPTLEELKGFRDAMLQLCSRVDLGNTRTIDLCGTGGDGKNTFNISTLCSFILAGAEILVTKHGNYGVSSISGSSNVLETLGISFAKDESTLLRQLESSNICFMHAPFFNPSMKAVANVRKKIGTKTIFNMLGPLCNPCQPKIQMTGVYDMELLRLYQYLLQDEHKEFTLIHGLDGYDEISLTGNVKVITNQHEKIFNKMELTNIKVNEKDIFGGASLKESSQIFINVLNGKGTKEQNEVVLINSAFAIKTYYPLLSLADAKSLAEDSLYNHKALNRFNQLKSIK